MERPFTTPPPSSTHSVNASKQESQYNDLVDEEPAPLTAIAPGGLPTPSHHLSVAATAGAGADPVALLKSLEDEMQRTVTAARERNQREAGEMDEESLSAPAALEEVDGIPLRISELRAARAAQDARTSVSVS